MQAYELYLIDRKNDPINSRKACLTFPEFVEYNRLTC